MCSLLCVLDQHWRELCLWNALFGAICILYCVLVALCAERNYLATQPTELLLHSAANIRFSTSLALPALPPVRVLTDAAASALLASTAPPPMLADAGASALLALTALPIVLTDAATSALLAFTMAFIANPIVLTDAGTSALLAFTLAADPFSNLSWIVSFLERLYLVKIHTLT